MREEAKVAKEIEEMKLKVGKEQSHFAKALDELNQKISHATSNAEMELMERKKGEIEKRLAAIERISKIFSIANSIRGQVVCTSFPT